MGNKSSRKAKGKSSRKSKKNSTKLTLGYWKIRGLAAPLRMMLSFNGEEYTDN